MPRVRHTYKETGTQAAAGTFDDAATGIDLDSEDPRALRLLDLDCSLQSFDAATEDFHRLQVFLKLSQEPDMTPGLLLPIKTYLFSGVGATNPNAIAIDYHARAIVGTMWVAKYWAIRVHEAGAVVEFAVNMTATFEVVPIDFNSQLLLWEQIDNVTDNEQDWWQL